MKIEQSLCTQPSRVERERDVRESRRGHGVMDRVSACGACSHGVISFDIQVFFPIWYKVVGKTLKPVMIKLYDLASPSRKKVIAKVIAMPSMGESSLSARYGN